MVKGQETILRLGGASRTNVFTRITLAIFGQVPWRAVPFLPVECVLLPRWFPFHLSKVSYWSRTVMVPLFILYTLKVRAIYEEIEKIFGRVPNIFKTYAHRRRPESRSIKRFLVASTK
jgi:squalene-hopene/tetraprenyl-beta-curcumene cyclase